MSMKWKSSSVSVGLKTSPLEKASHVIYRAQQKKQMQLENAKLEEKMKELKKIKDRKNNNTSDKKKENVGFSILTPLHPNLMKKSTSSAKSVHFADEIVQNTSPKEAKSKLFVRKLFDEHSSAPICSNELKDDCCDFRDFDPDGSFLSDFNEDSVCLTDHNDSSAEFQQYETLCGKLSPHNPTHIASAMKLFIEKQNAELLEKIAKLIKENSDTITSKLEELLQAGDMNKENSPRPLKASQKRKSGNLQKHLMKKAMQLKCPDTPATQRKMKESINIYNSMRQNLDSPRPFASSLNTPVKQASKKALSLIVQKQCLALVE